MATKMVYGVLYFDRHTLKMAFDCILVELKLVTFFLFSFFHRRNTNLNWFLFSAAQVRTNSPVGNVMDLNERHQGNDDDNCEKGKYSILASKNKHTFRKCPTAI